MIDQYPLNRDHIIKIVEQHKKKLLETLKATSVGLIRLAAVEDSANQAIQSISFYEGLWDEVFNYHPKWKKKIFETSSEYMTDDKRLNSELEPIEIDFTKAHIKQVLLQLINIKKKK